MKTIKVPDYEASPMVTKRQPKVERICVQCGTHFMEFASRVREGRGVNCSKQCQFLSQKGKRVAPQTEFRKGQVPHNFVGESMAISRSNGKPYRLIYRPNHPFATRRGYVREHRLVMEEELGRYLNPDEIVHHKDGNTLNNSPDNLEVMSKVEHDRMNVSLNIHRRWYA